MNRGGDSTAANMTTTAVKRSRKTATSPSPPSTTDDATSAQVEEDAAANKRRGRKPKSGKLLVHSSETSATLAVPTPTMAPLQTVILHLKCFLRELEDTPCMVASYHTSLPSSSMALEEKTETVPSDVSPPPPTTELWQKLKTLESQLHVNESCTHKSACFWCTYEYDNPTIYIPKHILKQTYHVYGSFCSPECAVAFLMRESLDTSVKFERLQLLHHLYAKLYDYSSGRIRPAPDPYYTLDKYCGNLSIQEYRSLFHQGRFFFVLEKPVVKLLPELHEDNEQFIMNNKWVASAHARKPTSSTVKVPTFQALSM